MLHDIYITGILSLVEGITEFLPVSSTGHLILINSWFGNLGGNENFTKMFDVVIQSGALLSVIVLYINRIWTSSQRLHLIKLLVVGVIPSLIMGFLFKDIISEYLFSPLVVSGALIIGGLIMIFPLKEQKHTSDGGAFHINYTQALLIGCGQCLALIPGISRSFASIYAGLFQGITRREATEFSFLLAVPTLGAASTYSLIKGVPVLSSNNILLLVIGFALSFIVALVVLRWFIKFVSTHNFFWFGIYRIILGVVVLVSSYFLIHS